MYAVRWSGAGGCGMSDVWVRGHHLGVTIFELTLFSLRVVYALRHLM